MFNCLLFHSLAEMFSIAVAGCVFAITWNTRIYCPKGSDFFLLIGISSLFVGGIDLIHTLAYKGMNVFHGLIPICPLNYGLPPATFKACFENRVAFSKTMIKLRQQKQDWFKWTSEFF